MNITGDIHLNGRDYQRGVLKAMSAYVMQDDVLHAELTVEETLFYASQLRLPSSFSDQQRAARVAEVIELMNIQACRKVIVGDTRRKGISGGERKRLCVAVELLAKVPLKKIHQIIKNK
jgi:ATP-binding cassette subfamily G (WHITE) protein 2